MAEWLGLIGALAGTAIGGLVTYKVANQQHAHERAQGREQRLTDNLESLYEVLSEIESQAATLNLGVIGDIAYNSKLKSDIVKERIQIDRLRMLTDFYAPELQPEVKSISQRLNIIGQAIGEVILAKERSEEWKSETIKTASQAASDIQHLARSAQTKLGQKMQSLAES